MAQSRAWPGDASWLRVQVLTDLGWHDSRAFTVPVGAAAPSGQPAHCPGLPRAARRDAAPLTHELARLKGQLGRRYALSEAISAAFGAAAKGLSQALPCRYG